MTPRADGDPDAETDGSLGPTFARRMRWLFENFPKEPEERGPRGGLVRPAKSFSKGEIAAKTGTTERYIREISNGNATRVTVELARKIARAFGAPEGVLATSDAEYELFRTLHERGIPPERVTVMFRGGDTGNSGDLSFVQKMLVDYLQNGPTGNSGTVEGDSQ